MFNRIFFVSAILLNLILVKAQTDVDALRFSQNFPVGTSRSSAFANASAALGADITNTYTNPAGIGLYRSSEALFSTSFLGINNSASYLNNKMNDTKYNFNFNNLGFVISNISDDENEDWKGFNFAVSMNRLNNFHRSMSFSGYNENNSMLDYYIERVNSNGGTNPGNIYNTYPFDAGLAWDAYLINPIDSIDTTHYVNVISDGGVSQIMSSVEKGAINEWDLSLGTNYKDRLYLGFSLGLPSIRYKKLSSYKESDAYDTIPGFNQFTLTEELNTSGFGVNAKLGMIYKINKYIRLGGAVHTPTYYDLTDNYASSVTSDLDTLGTYSSYSPNGEFRYNLYSPWKLVGGISVFIGKRGFISADYEFIDYSLAYYDFSAYSVNAEDQLAATSVNNDINNKYGKAESFRLGTEIIVSEKFAVRAGYAYYGDPFKIKLENEQSIDRSRQILSLGFGFKEGDFFFDFAYRRNLTQDYYTPYVLSSPTEGVKSTINTGGMSMTMGVKF